MSILLTLCTDSLRRRIGRSGKEGISLYDVPGFASKHLRLHGLNVPASMLSGWSLKDLDKLRDRADKAACPCLVLIEDTPIRFAEPNGHDRQESADRVKRLAVAANRLGCSALALRCKALDTLGALDQAAEEIKDLMPIMDRLELNLLLALHNGLTHSVENLTELIKRIGGFRIGSLPTFGDAAAAGGGEPIEGLRRLAPYAGAIHATIVGFTPKGLHETYDLGACVQAIRAVGFLNTLAIEYNGNADPIPVIERARDLLQAAIDDDQS